MDVFTPRCEIIPITTNNKIMIIKKAGGTSKLAKLSSKISAPTEAKTGGGAASWMTQGTKKIAAFVQSVKQNAARTRKPEFYVPEGETKQIRFREDDPVASFQSYSFRAGGKWNSYTAPGEGEVDMFQQNGLRPQFKVAYEIVDLDGYVAKKGKNAGKRVKNIPSFWILGMRLYEQVAILREKYGSLTERTFSVTRTGSKTSTVYTILPEDPEEMPELDKIPSIKDKFASFYAPPTLAEQKRLMSGFDPSEQDDNPPQRRAVREKDEEVED